MTAGLRQAWDRLLQADEGGSGWNTLRLLPETACTIRAAIRFPERVPALLVELMAVSVEKVKEYPSSRGFSVYPESITPGPRGQVRICLVLSDATHFEEFAALSEDVASSVALAKSEPEAVQRMLARLHAWQQFMRKHGDGLSVEEQTGLFAELLVLNRLLGSLSPTEVLEAWRGPVGGIRDFQMRHCDIEVKATTSPSPGPFHVGSVGQLDETGLQQLLLCHITLSINSQGDTLTDVVRITRQRMLESGSANKDRFNDLLMVVGYTDAQAVQYQARRLSMRVCQFYRVEGAFPRLRRADLSPGIVDVSYLVDIGACSAFRIDEDTANALIVGGEI
jgi:hypothetical protein